jgi:hypothetical protein
MKVLVLEGDWGGTIYATLPVDYLKRNFEIVCELAAKLEQSSWGCNIDEDSPSGGASAYLTDAEIGDGVLGGMGGGLVADGLWVHPSLSEAEKTLITETLGVQIAKDFQRRADSFTCDYCSKGCDDNKAWAQDNEGFYHIQCIPMDKEEA